jgi:hypothetical protein
MFFGPISTFFAVDWLPLNFFITYKSTTISMWDSVVSKSMPVAVSNYLGIEEMKDH